VAHVTTTPEFVKHILIHDLRRLSGRTEATVICTDGPDLAEVRAEGIRVIPVPIERKITPTADLVALFRLVRLLRRERFDLVHTYVPKGGFLGQLAAALARAPARIHSCRGLLYTPTMPAWRRRLFRLTDRLTNALAHRTIFISRADRDFSVSSGLCSAAKARLTGSGIDLTHFDPARLPADTRAATRQELGLRSDAPVVLTVGRFVADKGYLELADAAASVRREHPEVRFVWVAPVLAGEEGALPEAFLESRGLAGTVLRLPMQRDVRRLYLAADLLAHPSHREGVPRVLMEAAAMGLPIIASDIPGCREVVTNGRTARLVPVRDSGALARAIGAALADPVETSALARLARISASECFDQDALTERIGAVYRELLKGGGS
jgi:glycosyltransferase involved in cell wall biosynthesis